MVMISFTLIFIFFILGAICIIFFFASFLRLFEYLYPRLSYYQQQNQQRKIGNRQYTRITQGNIPEEKVDYSIIYTVHRVPSQRIEFVSIKQQIEIIYVLMKEYIKENEKFEIVCVIDPNNYEIFRYICSLYQEHRYITPVLKSTKGIEYFINGFMNSKGLIIIDSEYIAEEITKFIEFDQDKPFIEFIEPKTENSLISQKEDHFLQPILMTRVAGEKVFSNLHMTNFGSSNELLYICKNFCIETQIQPQKIGITDISIMNVIITLINERLCNFLYSQKYWSLK